MLELYYRFKTLHDYYCFSQARFRMASNSMLLTRKSLRPFKTYPIYLIFKILILRTTRQARQLYNQIRKLKCVLLLYPIFTQFCNKSMYIFVQTLIKVYQKLMFCLLSSDTLQSYCSFVLPSNFRASLVVILVYECFFKSLCFCKNKIEDFFYILNMQEDFYRGLKQVLVYFQGGEIKHKLSISLYCISGCALGSGKGRVEKSLKQCQDLHLKLKVA